MSENRREQHFMIISQNIVFWYYYDIWHKFEIVFVGFGVQQISRLIF